MNILVIKILVTEVIITQCAKCYEQPKEEAIFYLALYGQISSQKTMTSRENRLLIGLEC